MATQTPTSLAHHRLSPFSVQSFQFLHSEFSESLVLRTANGTTFRRSVPHLLSVMTYVFQTAIPKCGFFASFGWSNYSAQSELSPGIETGDSVA